MQFEEGTLHAMIFGTSQHLEIPHFQRPYSWDKDLWRTLLIDVLHQYVNYKKLHTNFRDDPDQFESLLEQQAKHYLGAIVTDSGSAVIPPRSRVLDGQQRLLTCSVLYLAIRDAQILSLDKTADITEHERIYAGYKDGFRNAQASPERELRVKPQAVDLAAWNHLLDPNRSIKPVKSEDVIGNKDSAKLIAAYNYFLRELRRREVQPDFYEIQLAEDLFPLDFEMLKNVVLTRLWMVRILCSNSDDVNAIFESLNAKSKPLQQVDLIKNYLYLSLKSKADKVYADHWVPLESNLEHETLERYVWAYTVSTGENISQRKTYESIRRQLPPAKSELIEPWVIALKTESTTYSRILNPTHEPDLDIRQALSNVSAANGATAEPMMLYVFREYHAGRASKEELVKALAAIESLLVRRLITGEGTQMLNPMFSSSCGKLFQSDGPYSRTGNLVEDIQRVLSAPEARWPDSESVLHGVMNNNFYTSQKTQQRMHILTNLDRALGGAVFLDYVWSDKTIEHVVPQSFPDHWKAAFEPEEVSVVENQLNSLVNLCILPRDDNSGLGNLPWSSKRAEYSAAQYHSTKDLLNYEVNGGWHYESMVKRAKRLQELIDERWPRNYLPPLK